MLFTMHVYQYQLDKVQKGISSGGNSSLSDHSLRDTFATKFVNFVWMYSSTAMSTSKSFIVERDSSAVKCRTLIIIIMI